MKKVFELIKKEIKDLVCAVKFIKISSINSLALSYRFCIAYKEALFQNHFLAVLSVE